jgi:hypothetical protein
VKEAEEKGTRQVLLDRGYDAIQVSRLFSLNSIMEWSRQRPGEAAAIVERDQRSSKG